MNETTLAEDKENSKADRENNNSSLNVEKEIERTVSDSSSTPVPITNTSTASNQQNCIRTHRALTATSSGLSSTSRIVRGTHFSTRRIVLLPRVDTSRIASIPTTDVNNTEFTNEGERSDSQRNSTNQSSRQQISLQGDSQNIYAGLTPPPPALLSSTIPTDRSFKVKIASKTSCLQLGSGITEIVCGLGLGQGVQGSHLPFYFQSMMPIWTGAIYLMTAIAGTIAISNPKRLPITLFLCFGLISLALSIALSAFIAPDVTSYDTDKCYHGNNSNTNPGDVNYDPSANPSLTCNEAQLITVLAAISLGFGLLDAISSFVICVICGQVLCRCCSKPDINVLQEAPVFFRVGTHGEMEARIITGARNAPIVVPLPQYEDVPNQCTREETDIADISSNNRVPPSTPPPAYRSTVSLETETSGETDNNATM